MGGNPSMLNYMFENEMRQKNYRDFNHELASPMFMPNIIKESPR